MMGCFYVAVGGQRRPLHSALFPAHHLRFASSIFRPEEEIAAARAPYFCREVRAEQSRCALPHSLSTVHQLEKQYCIQSLTVVVSKLEVSRRFLAYTSGHREWKPRCSLDHRAFSEEEKKPDRTVRYDDTCH